MEQDKHQKGAGISLYGIAKIVNQIHFDFRAINSDKYEYHHVTGIYFKIKTSFFMFKSSKIF
ncbi:MAG: hypothetical protein HQL46_10345 [Gammaproteobacteria bacterium]|nr:hypothetical protein [Gammaproteobacteria bacterium]